MNNSNTDAEFLRWMYERLLYVHGENPHYGYMHRMHKVVEKMEQKRL
jgi:hypothetical protein